MHVLSAQMKPMKNYVHHTICAVVEDLNRKKRAPNLKTITAAIKRLESFQVKIQVTPGLDFSRAGRRGGHVRSEFTVLFFFVFYSGFEHYRPAVKIEFILDKNGTVHTHTSDSVYEDMSFHSNQRTDE